jgi:hypothetical protein
VVKWGHSVDTEDLEDMKGTDQAGPACQQTVEVQTGRLPSRGGGILRCDRTLARGRAHSFVWLDAPLSKHNPTTLEE